MINLVVIVLLSVSFLAIFYSTTYAFNKLKTLKSNTEVKKKFCVCVCVYMHNLMLILWDLCSFFNNLSCFSFHNFFVIFGKTDD